MPSQDSERKPFFRARFAALYAALALAAPAGASAAPTLTVLHSFTGVEVSSDIDPIPDSNDGARPAAGLIFDSGGNLRGTTSAGGPGAFFGLSGTIYTCGTVFSLAPVGSETVFPVVGFGGCTPVAGLIADKSGNLFGTTVHGGFSANFNCSQSNNIFPGCGTVFSLGTGALHNFTGFPDLPGPPTDGAFPAAGLVADSSGNLYGTTTSGGPSGFGTVFKLSPNGTSYTILHSFAGGASDGADPTAALIIDSGGNLYGTTDSGGSGGVRRHFPSRVRRGVQACTGRHPESAALVCRRHQRRGSSLRQPDFRQQRQSLWDYPKRRGVDVGM